MILTTEVKITIQIKLGFKNIEYSNPNCYYVNNFMKFENMITDNDLKIYDSGNIIYNKII